MSPDFGLYPDIEASRSGVAMVVVGKDGVIRHHTRHAAALLARRETDLVGRSFPAFFTPSAGESVDALLRKVSDPDMRLGTFIEATCVLGGVDPQPIQVTCVRLSEEPVLVVVVLSPFEDRPKPRSTPDLVQAAAQFDQLTGLLNRRAMDETFQAFFSGADIRQVVVAAWDMDGLKLINDTHGHAVGDQVLRWVGYRLEGTLGAYGAVARTGGDEFTVLLPDVGPAEGKASLEHALEAIRVPMGALDIQVSIGCGAAWSTTTTNWQTVWQKADMALYVGKRAKNQGINFFPTDDPM